MAELRLAFLKNCAFFVIILVTLGSSYGQNHKKSIGEYTMKIDPSVTRNEAERIAIERARINAIEQAFGMELLQGNSLYVSNSDTTENPETRSGFIFYSTSYANGEWLRDIDEPTIYVQDDWITVTVRCEVRPLPTQVFSVEASTGMCADYRRCETADFKEGQDFYVYFKAAIQGYVAVYLDNPVEGVTYRLLPYSGDYANTGYAVAANQGYVFFSEAHNATNSHIAADELSLSLSRDKLPEQNILYILFSPDKLGMPILEKPESQPLPPYLPSHEFMDWQYRQRSQNQAIQLLMMSIRISPI